MNPPLQPPSDDATVAALVQTALHDPDVRRARAVAQQMLGPGIDMPAVIAGLTDGLRHADAFVRRRAAQALALLGPAAVPALDGLTAALRDPNWIVREAVAPALAVFPDDLELVRRELLTCALHDPNPLVRGAAAQAVARRRLGPRADLGPSLQHPHASVRRRAVEVLRQLSPSTPDVVPLLREALEDGHVKVRRAAAQALGAMGASAVPVLPRLVRCACEADWRVEEAARKAVVQLLSEPGAVPLRWLAETVGFHGIEPEQALLAGLDRPDLPGRVREEFLAACGRRRLWHRGRRRLPPPAESAPPPATASPWEVAVAAAAAAASQAEADWEAEYAWLLGLLCQLWLDAGTAQPAVGTMAP